MNTILIIVAVLLGAAMGGAFGLWLQRPGPAKSKWTPAQRAAVRYLCLLLVLAAVQMLCPQVFQGGLRWWVAAGLLAGFGYVRLTYILRLRKAGGA